MDEYGLSDAELDHFNERGYVIVEELYDRETAQRLKSHGIDMCLNPDTPPEHVIKNALVDVGVVQRDGAQALHSFWRPHVISETYRDVCFDPKITGRLASILGPNVVTFNGLVIFKTREIGLAFPYHQDMWYFKKGNDIERSCGIWMALDDADEENGCLWVVPGSHKLPLQEHDEPEGEHVQREFREVRAARDMDEIPVPINAGGCLFFDGQLLHRSGRNESDRDRACYVIHNTSADTVFRMRGLEKRAVMATRGDRDPQFDVAS